MGSSRRIVVRRLRPRAINAAALPYLVPVSGDAMPKHARTGAHGA
jgi:hypothetical protein